MFFLLLLFLCFIEIRVRIANSVDLDQTPRNAASDLGLHCLPMSLLWDTRHKWVTTEGLNCKKLSLTLF